MDKKNSVQKRHAMYSRRRERSLSNESNSRRPERGNRSSKKDNSKTGRVVFAVTKSLTFGKNVKKRRAQRTLAKTLALDRRNVRAGINKREQTLKPQKGK